MVRPRALPDPTASAEVMTRVAMERLGSARRLMHRPDHRIRTLAMVHRPTGALPPLRRFVSPGPGQPKEASPTPRTTRGLPLRAGAGGVPTSE